MKIISKFVLLTCAAALFGMPTTALAQVLVRVAEVRQEKLQQRQAVTGTLRAVSRGDVAALEPGRLMKLSVREGDVVKQGDVIAEIDSRRLQAQRAIAVADLRVAEAEMQRRQAIAKRATADLARNERLVRENAVSRQEYDSALADSDIANAEIEAAKRQILRATEAIRLLDVRLSDTKLSVPYDAYIVARHIEPGDWVQPGDSLLTLISTGVVNAWLEVPERLADSLTKDCGVAIQLAATGRPLSTIRTKRVADVNQRVRTIQLIATVENPAGVLLPGMSVKGWVPSGGSGNYLTVPKDAIVRRGGQSNVFAVDETGKSNQILVRILFETTDRVAVESSRLKAGTQVITEGNERLLPDQVVSVVNER